MLFWLRNKVSYDFRKGEGREQIRRVRFLFPNNDMEKECNAIPRVS